MSHGKKVKLSGKQRRMVRKIWKSMQADEEDWKNDEKAEEWDAADYVNGATKPPAFLELFTPPQMPPLFSKLHPEAVTLSLDLTNGWNALLPKNQSRVMQRLETHNPHSVIMSPPCVAFSALQNLNAAFQASVKGRQQWTDGVAMIKFCVKVALWQIRHQRHFVIEHPKGASSWSLQVLQKLIANAATQLVCTDFCQFGLQDPGTNKPIKKPTRLLTTLPTKLLVRKCTHVSDEHEHVQGGTKLPSGRWISRSKYCQEYTPAFIQAVVRTVTLSMATDATVEAHRCCAVEENKDDTMGEEQERSQGEKYLVQGRRLHINLGHPDVRTTRLMLRLGKADKRLVEASCKACEACTECAVTKRNKSNAPGRVPKPYSYDFNQVLGVDIFFVDGWFPREEKGKVGMLNMIDWGTQHQIVVPLRSRSSEQVRRTYRRFWLNVYGRPGRIVSDGEKEIFSGCFGDRCAAEGALLDPSGAQSPHQNGRTERAGGTWTSTFERVCLSCKLESEEDFQDAVTATNIAIGERRSYQRIFGRPISLPEGMEAPMWMTSRCPQWRQCRGRKQATKVSSVRCAFGWRLARLFWKRISCRDGEERCTDKPPRCRVLMQAHRSTSGGTRSRRREWQLIGPALRLLLWRTKAKPPCCGGTRSYAATPNSFDSRRRMSCWRSVELPRSSRSMQSTRPTTKNRGHHTGRQPN